MNYVFIKRMLDFIISTALILVVCFPLALVLLLVKLTSKGPVLFVQQRPGYKGEIFRIYKIRTMVVDTHRDGRELSDFERMTRIGKIIRKLSLDELPQLWNVWKGEMSFIGPRPLLVEYLGYYSEEQKRRHDVLPGITGWAQVNGRNAISWEEKFKFDVEYVDCISLLLDLKIILLTIKKVFIREGVNQAENVVMMKFQGSEEK